MSKTNAANKMAECRQIISEVVEATENAVNAIIGEVEKLQATVKGKKEQEYLSNVVEACSFQDITGQRLNKMVKIIDQIEGRAPANATAERLKQEAAGLLEGPASQAKSQEDIDKLFGKE